MFKRFYFSFRPSFREWWVKVPQRWWGMIGLSLTLAPLLAGLGVFTWWAMTVEPPLPWWNILLVLGGAVLFVTVSFATFHRVRVERDIARDALQTKVSTREQRKAIADKLAEFFVSGDGLLMSVVRKTETHPLQVYRVWLDELKQYFQDNPDSLGLAKLIGLGLSNSDPVNLLPEQEYTDESRYVCSLLTGIQDKLKKMVEEFLR